MPYRRDTSAYVCDTQRPERDPYAIKVGAKAVLALWAPGSVLDFNVDVSSFPHPFMAEYAGKRLQEAANRWNDGHVGVKFRRLPNTEKPLFVLRFAEDIQEGKGDTHAMSRFRC
ncbi:hypothetical protein F4780DRAFT_766634 [Xylariomycetidae sp. FL0641]|nr:hypothetical protein F4780DRAFT_766634 [Xylariomycetidae sp. FL0641]